MKSVRWLSGLLFLFALTAEAFACPWCRLQVRNDLYDDGFGSTLFLLLLPLLILLAGSAALYYFDRLTEKFRRRIK